MSNVTSKQYPFTNMAAVVVGTEYPSTPWLWVGTEGTLTIKNSNGDTVDWGTVSGYVMAESVEVVTGSTAAAIVRLF